MTEQSLHKLLALSCVCSSRIEKKAVQEEKMSCTL